VDSYVRQEPHQRSFSEWAHQAAPTPPSVRFDTQSFSAALRSPTNQGALNQFVLFMDPKQAFAFLGYYVGISFIFRGLWTVVFVGEAHEIGHVVREAIA
jgi:hypothetical protein